MTLNKLAERTSGSNKRGSPFYGLLDYGLSVAGRRRLLKYHRHRSVLLMPKKIDPLNRKNYGAVSVALTVADIPAAAKFYQQAFGFAKRSSMNGPDGKPIHAE